ncbi:three-helix bundle dimerization domain-containing protein [Agromyces sp. MMS24-K17]|uniref:three-helix bundle dimerization domain-containing protein n=1 Tax=Agromyces sp. MMS24-K17 TaxID=3372850 RepID=UPI003754CF40
MSTDPIDRDQQAGEDELVEQVVDRVAERFPGASRDEVEHVVDEERHRLDGNPIRDFVPVLVEHEARDRLREEGYEPAERAATADAAEGPAAGGHEASPGPQRDATGELRAGTESDRIQAPLGIVGAEGAVD